MKSLLFEVSTADPLTYVAASAALILAAAVASYLPARRATRVDPAGSSARGITPEPAAQEGGGACEKRHHKPMMKTLKAMVIAALFETVTRGQVDLSALSFPGNAALEQATKLMRRGEYRKAIDAYDWASATDPIARNAENRAVTLAAAAGAEIELGDYAEAEAGRPVKRSAGFYAPQRNAPLHSPIAESELVDALLAQGKSGEARARSSPRGDTRCRNAWSGPTPPFGLVPISYAGVLKETSDLRRAEETCSRATAIFENAGDSLAGGAGDGYQCLAVVQAQRRRPKAALESIRRALALWNSRLPSKQPILFIVYALNTQMVVHKDLTVFSSGGRH